MNQNLVYSIKKRLPLNGYDRDTFYVIHSTAGYLYYTFNKQFLFMLENLVTSFNHEPKTRDGRWSVIADLDRGVAAERHIFWLRREGR